VCQIIQRKAKKLSNKKKQRFCHLATSKKQKQMLMPRNFETKITS
jgi:hypothetical protein